MCPACFAAVAWVIAGAVSAGGLTAVIANTKKSKASDTAETRNK